MRACFLALVVLTLVSTCSPEPGPPRVEIRSSAFGLFDVEVFLLQYRTLFGTVTGAGTRTNVRVTPSGDWTSEFHVEGPIAAADLAALLRQLREQMDSLLQASDAQAVGAAQETIEEGRFVGFVLRYAEGENTGRIEAAIQPGAKEGTLRLACAIREQIN